MENTGMRNRKIITHCGAAHADEVVSIALLLAEDPAINEINRVSKPTKEDLASPDAYVLDIGNRYEPHLLNFDHHQFSRDEPPRCTFSLILENSGHTETATRIWSWLEAFVVWDVGGPPAVADLYNIKKPGIFKELGSPVHFAVLQIFSDADVFQEGGTEFHMLKRIGSTMLEELRQVPVLVDWFSQKCVFRTADSHNVLQNHSGLNGLKAADIKDVIVPVFPKCSRGLGENALHLFLKEKAPSAELVVMPDSREGGWVLRRRLKSKNINFEILAGDPDVEYIHSSGFLAVSRTGTPEALERLLKLVRVKI